MGGAYLIGRLTGDAAAAYRDIRLESLRDAPAAFTADWAEQSARPLAEFAARLDTGFVLGGWSGDGVLMGTAGFYVKDGAKLAHKGVLWGMYVRPAARGTGLGGALVSGIIAEAKRHVGELTLGVAVENASALALYRAMGFVECGYEARLMKVDGREIDELILALRF